MDIEDELSSMLSEELAKSIDAEIMKRLFSESKLDKINKILEKINKSNDKG
jgi:thymidylate synthase